MMFRVRTRVAAALVLALAACGGPKGPVSTVPLPDDPPAPGTPVAAKEPAPPESAKPPAAAPPLDLELAAVVPTFKLVSAGKGKKSPLAYGLTQGSKQSVELALGLDTDLAAPASGKARHSVLPTLVLTADTEITNVAADGAATYALVVTKVGAKAAEGQEATPEDFRDLLATTITGMQMTGSIAANGTFGATKVHVEHADEMTGAALGLVAVAMPRWPMLPPDAVGVGAKWTVTWPSLLQDQIAVAYATDYELTARTATTWTVKATTKVTGADQTLGDPKAGPTSAISKITGTGTATVTATTGVLFPVATEALETVFVATQGGDALTVDYKMAGSIGPAAAPTK